MKQTIFSAIVIILFMISAFDCFGQQKISIYPQPDSPLQLSSVVPKQRTMMDDNGREW